MTEVKSDFPPPPAYWEAFDSDACLPTPPKPVTGTYTHLGCEDTTEDAVAQLKPSERVYVLHTDKLVEIKHHLLALNKELMFAAADLMGALVERPSQYSRKLEAVTKLLRNMHDLINLIRPHQARETLRYTLQQQVDQRREALQMFAAQMQQADELVETLAASLTACVDGGNDTNDEVAQPQPVFAGQPSADVATTRLDDDVEMQNFHNLANGSVMDTESI